MRAIDSRSQRGRWQCLLAVAACAVGAVQSSQAVAAATLAQQAPHTKPRVILAFVSDQDWAFLEFLCMLHASWRHILMLPGSQDYKLDLLVFTAERHHRQVATLCQTLDLQAPRDVSTGMHPDFRPALSQCFSVPWPLPPKDQWHGWPFINNVHMFTDPHVRNHLEHHYGYAMKTDCDTFVTPSLLHYFPDKFTFGIQEYVVMEQTAQRLAAVAEKLRLPAPRVHNLGPTWYGHVSSLLRLAQASVPVMHEIITQEFEQLPGGGIKQAWQRGEGFPEWSAGMGALYATELVAAPTLNEYESTPKMDAHGDSDGLLVGFHHVHARHGDSYFSKFEFFQHHYDHVNLGQLDVSIVREYCVFVAVSTWRQLLEVQRSASATVRPPTLDSPRQTPQDEL